MNGNAFAFDNEGVIIAHPNSNLKGKSIESIKDIKGRNLVKTMNVDRQKFDGESAVFFWLDENLSKNQKKLGYFQPYKALNITVCAEIDFEKIEAKSQKKLENIIQVLQKTFEKIRIGKTGFVFLFDGKGKILIEPPEENNINFTVARNSYSSNLLLDDFKRQFEENNRKFRFLHDSQTLLREFESHIGYFKAFDWYIVVCVPVEEMQQPAKKIVAQQSIIIISIFLASISIAYFFVARISRPIKMLSNYAKEISTLDFK